MKTELLLPAGTLDKMRCAYDFGADAVYAGQPRYSLRARNNEFKLENLKICVKVNFIKSSNYTLPCNTTSIFILNTFTSHFLIVFGNNRTFSFITVSCCCKKCKLHQHQKYANFFHNFNFLFYTFESRLINATMRIKLRFISQRIDFFKRAIVALYKFYGSENIVKIASSTSESISSSDQRLFS